MEEKRRKRIWIPLYFGTPIIRIFPFFMMVSHFSEILDRTTITATEQEQNQEFARYTISYALPDGLTVVQLLTVYKKWNAAHWVLQFSNSGEKKSGLLSQVRDCDMAFPFLYDRKTPVAGHVIAGKYYAGVSYHWFRLEKRRVCILSGIFIEWSSTALRMCWRTFFSRSCPFF